MRLSNALIEKRRPAFFAAGLLFALSITLVSFEWRTPYTEPKTPEVGAIPDGPQGLVIRLEDPKKEIEKPEPPKEEEKKSNELEVVDNKKAVESKTDDFDPFEDLDDPVIGGEPEEISVPDDFGPVNFSEVPPAYCGGERAMMEFLSANLKYPAIPLENGVSGTVYVKFVVGKNGKLRDAKVAKAIDPWLDAEALRVAKMLHCFTPGKQAGRNVAVYFVLPVRFVINR